MEVFDIHHLGSLSGGSLQEGGGWQERDHANRVRVMDANGVTLAEIRLAKIADADKENILALNAKRLFQLA